MPMLRDDGPPVSARTIQEARESLHEYGWKIVTENGRRVLIVRTPKPKPDYLKELRDVALHVPIEDVKDVKDVVLVGSVKSCRVEPVALRDRIREQRERDEALVEDWRPHLRRDYGAALSKLPHDEERVVIAVRVPHRDVSAFTPEDVWNVRSAVEDVEAPRDAAVLYLIADNDHERVVPPTLAELLGWESATPDAPAEAAAEPAPEAAPPAVDPDEDPAASGSAAAGLLAEAGIGVDLGDQDATLTTRAAPSEPVDTPPQAEDPPAPATAAESLDDQDAEIMTRVPVQEPEADGAAAAEAEAPVDAPASETTHLDDQDAEIMTRAPGPGPAEEATPGEAPAPAHHVTTAPSETAYSDGTLPQRVMELVEENEEYEVTVTKRTPLVDLPESAAAAPAPAPAPVRVEDEGAHEADAPPRVASPTGPSGDNGTTVEPSVVAHVDGVGALRTKLLDDDYEVMTDVDVMGHTFDLAAHKMEGKRILVKRHAKMSRETLEEMKRVAAELGADVCICVTTDAEAGVRLGSWGTLVEVLTHEEAASLEL